MKSKIIGIILSLAITIPSVINVAAETKITKKYDGNNRYETITVNSDGIIIDSCTNVGFDTAKNIYSSIAQNKIDSLKRKMLKKFDVLYFGIPGISINEQDTNEKDKPVDIPTNNNTTENKEDKQPSGSTVYPESVTKVVALTNAERAVYGLPALRLSDALCSSAQAHAEDMYTNNYFSHTSQDGRTLSDRIEKYSNKYSCMGENIARGYGTPEAAVEGWMNSEGHRANILDKSYTDIGVGYCNGYWVQNFGG